MSHFKIEMVKWSWAPAVKSKNIYRDDEFVRANSKEEALAAIDFLMMRPKGLTYTITVRREDVYFTYYRHSMPCYGGLVKYRDSHGERYFMNPYFPRDIRVAFPEGDIIFIACHVAKTAVQSAYGEFVFSAESPWVSAFGSRETIIFKDSYLVLTNMDTDPTVFYSFMRYGGLSAGYKISPKAVILAAQNSYADPRRLAGQKPLRISGGTWAEGFGYTRPYNESIFKTTLPNKLADFGKLGGYPPAPFSNTYFTTEMKKNFGVSGCTVDPKFEKPLVEAWDYFKEQSKELSEYTDHSKSHTTSSIYPIERRKPLH